MDKDNIIPLIKDAEARQRIRDKIVERKRTLPEILADVNAQMNAIRETARKSEVYMRSTDPEYRSSSVSLGYGIRNEHDVPPPPPPPAPKEATLAGGLDEKKLQEEYRRKQDEMQRKREENNRQVSRLYQLDGRKPKPGKSGPGKGGK